ncbi:MAG TPA: Hsp20/alpha crystallin family protein [Gammaproteobacteria bacterium]|nr:Hsp20/alpha crystallin family protein [Gammaproteobacteria bacterium]
MMATRGKKQEQKEQPVPEAQPAKSGQLMTPFEEVEQIFENLVPRGWMRPRMWDWPRLGEFGRPLQAMRVPRVDLIDRDDEVVLKAEIPGVRKEDLDISVSDGSVIIKGTTSREDKQETGDYFRSEIYHGEFSRSVALPSEVDSDKAKAKFADGLLEISMPKLGKAKRRRISVQ